MSVNKKILKQRIVPLMYLLPSIFFMAIFVAIPIGMSLYMSFFRIESVNAAWQFSGFANFTDVFQKKDFSQTILRTIVLATFTVVTTVGFGLLLANLVASHKRLNFFRYIFYVPSVVSAVTMGRLWSMMLIPSASGLMNRILMDFFGLAAPINWLGDPKIALYVIMGISLVGVGGGMTLILFTTAINDISQEVKEAAILDGVNSWQMFRRIVIPLISPIISSWTILSIIAAFKSFELIYSLTGGGPAKSTQTIAIALYESAKASSNGYGYSAAMGFILTLFISIFTLVFMKVFKINQVERTGG